MTDVTKINTSLSDNSTIINDSLSSASSQTVINVELPKTDISLSTVLGGKYVLNKKLEVNSGEADLFICTFEGKDYIAKIYRRERSIKKEVVDAIKEIDSPYVATCYDTGEVNGHVYEIIPYYKNGSVQGKKVSFEDLKNIYIPSLNEGLKLLHDKNLIHKDLKPSNIMLNDDGKSVAIIDFGISSVIDSGATMIVTSTGMTPIYSAPETYRNMFFDISDYYSLGITLYELFTGRLPYTGMNQEEMERFVSVSRIPLPDNMPLELKELILGLTYGDITNRHNKDNPNRRWSYEEVKKWLKGIRQVLPGEGVSSNNTPEYLFDEIEYTSTPELVQALAEKWELGKKHLFRGYLTRHFSKFDPHAEEICRNAEIKSSQGGVIDDFVFWEAIVKLDPGSKIFYWKGAKYLNLPAFGRDIIERLQINDDSILHFMDGVISNRVISVFLEINESRNIDKIDAFKNMENYFITLKDDRQKKIQLYIIGYAMSGQAVLKVNGHDFNSIDDFTRYLKELSKDPINSFVEFKKISRELMISDKTLNPQFEAWLQKKGKRETIEKWREAMNISKEEYEE